MRSPMRNGRAGGFRPSEWEVAARAGEAENRYPWGETPPQTSTPISTISAAAPRRSAAIALGDNALGLSDCCGNVWEWCSDSWDEALLKTIGQDFSGSALADRQRAACHSRRQFRQPRHSRSHQLPPPAGQSRHARGCRLPRRIRSRVMANPAMPLGDPDATIVVGAGDADATLVVGAPPAGARPPSSPPSTSSSAPVAGNAARVEFLRKVRRAPRPSLRRKPPIPR